MTNMQDRVRRSGSPYRRQVVAYALAGLTTASLMSTTVYAQSVDLSQWSPEYIKSIAGTATYDTAADCGAVVPNDYAGKVSYWYTGPFEADPQIAHDQDKAFWEAFKVAYPNIQTDVQSITYNELLDKFRTALLGNAAPMVVRLQILGGVEFAAKGYLNPLKPEDVGYTTGDFWPGALKSVTWEGETYGIPTNNETMGFIWNAKIFADAGLDPESPPKTWDDVVTYSKTIHDKLGIAGYGLVAKQNAGNTPFRFMPQLWAYGGGALDETSAEPAYETVELNNDGSKAALQAAYDMYVRDQSVPTSALTNTQAENQAPFIAGQLAMMIAHPAEYAKMLDLASKATGADKATADAVVENMRYGLLPEGPARRAVVFGGSNIHVVKPEYVDGGAIDEQAVKALICMWTSPEWSTKLSWVGSNPGHLGGFKTEWMKERLDTIKFLDVTTSMLPNGIPFPVQPYAPEIMNIIVPDMLQNALTGTMSVEDAANDAAAKVEELMSGM
ncbi:ABC transporter substrate-binding protein [Devosia riboflavina]|uniref:ABC transporter substrate-binding protein n=1 Tax=Devosia riboflavina TaxID=46914 RepID=A0A087M3T8_9HYPH|nr:ABC transporter substrate-binding protein [Devosia riboflavina]